LAIKIINVIGARSDFMKVAPLVEAMERRGQRFAPPSRRRASRRRGTATPQTASSTHS
jgi:hypothetical protein